MMRVAFCGGFEIPKTICILRKDGKGWCGKEFILSEFERDPEKNFEDTWRELGEMLICQQ